MAKSSSASAFDDLLETFSDEADRKAFEELAGKNPKVLEYGLRQSDYSRKLNELQGDIQELTEWRGWRDHNWDDSQNMTKAELAKTQKLQALEQEKAELENRIALGLGGDDVTLAELEAYGKKWIDDNGVLTKTQLEAKEREFQDLVVGSNRFTATAALTIPILNAKHEREFGEFFDPQEFWQESAKRNCLSAEQMRNFYNEWTSDKRSTREKENYEKQLKEFQEKAEADKAAAKEEGKREAALATASGQSPVDGGSPEMGAFQSRYMGLEKEKADDGAPQSEVGDGALAAYYTQKVREQRANRA